MKTALKLAKRDSLENLIVEAGDIQSEISAKTAKYKELRKEIEARMSIPDGEKEAAAYSGDYVAKLYYAEKTSVNPERLHALSPDIFWRVCNVPVAAVKSVLARDDFFVVTEVNVEPLPTLRITKLKD